MAKRTITINDGSKEREQVELHLNPLDLNPTITAGGNYRVAVQDTPKTNQAYQLAAALKESVGLYGKAVSVAQKKAAEDVATMSDEEYNKVIQAGLDKEGKSLFGYTKAYNETLAQKYYSQTIPMKLQEVASELHKDPYAYKDVASFDAAAEKAMGAVFQEADELLSGNFFAERANQALQSAAKTDFLVKQRASYMQKLPEIIQKNKQELAYETFRDLEKLDEAPETIEAIFNSNTSALGSKIGALTTASAYLDVVELAIENDEEDKAEYLLAQLSDAKTGKEYGRKFNGVELFNTKEQRARIEKLEDALELVDDKRFKEAEKNSKVLSAELSLHTRDLLNDFDEVEAGTKLREIREQMVSGAFEFNGKTYTDPLVLASAAEWVDKTLANPVLFKNEYREQFIHQSTDPAQRQLALSTFDVQSLITQRGDLDLLGKYNAITGQTNLSNSGRLFQSEAVAEHKRLEFALFDSVSHLPRPEQVLEYKAKYTESVIKPLQAYVDNKIASLTETPLQEGEERDDKKYFTKEEETYLRESGFLPNEVEEIKTETIATRKAIEAAEVFQPTGDGGRELKGASGIFYRNEVVSHYFKAKDDDLFEDANEQIKGFNAVRRRMTTEQRNGTLPSPMSNLYSIYNRKPFFRNLTVTELINRRREMREKFSRYGISAAELSRDRLNFKDDISVTEFYGGIPAFSDFPIVINNSVAPTVALVSEYKETGQVKASALDEIAEQYDIPVETVLDAQYQYFKSNNFIRN